MDKSKDNVVLLYAAPRERRSSSKQFPSLPLCVSSVFVSWILFWVCFGHDLGYDVYQNDTYWHSEEFTPLGKVIITTAVAIGTGLPLAASIQFLIARRSR